MRLRSEKSRSPVSSVRLPEGAQAPAAERGSPGRSTPLWQRLSRSLAHRARGEALPLGKARSIAGRTERGGVAAAEEEGRAQATLAGRPDFWLRRAVRLAVRVVWLGAEIARAVLDYFINVVSLSEEPSLRRRARWLQRACVRTLPILGVHLNVYGRAPQGGLLVCNHLSYLDVLVLSALTPAVFVSKSEVGGWPIFGWFARRAGTRFVRREQRADVTRVLEEMRAVLEAGVVLVLFAEGTSSDGREVLPFKSSLLEPAIGLDQPVWAGCLSYRLWDGDAGREVCYWGDMTFGPHLLNLMAKRSVLATVRFTRCDGEPSGRKELGRRLHAEVSRLLAEARRAEGTTEH
jgi:1-acyl-sn-glycerol-3-phosphate acyltransferase